MSQIDLVAAILARDHARVAALLKAGADPEAADADSSALCHACFDGDKRLVAALLGAGADPARPDGRGFLPIHVAASKDRSAVIGQLLKAGVSVDVRGNENGTALHVAAAQGCAAAVRALLKAGADFDAIDVHGASPVSYAALHGHPKALKLLLTAGANPDLADTNGRTPLLHALAGARRLRQEHWEAAGTRNGSDIEFVIRHGLFLIREGGREFEPYPAKVGREISADINPDHVRYLDALSAATALIKAGANIQAKDATGWSVLHAAMAVGEHALVSRLLKAKTDGAARDDHGVQPVHAAAGSGRDDLFDRCRTRFEKLDFTQRDDAGLAPFHHAVIAGSLPIARRLESGTSLLTPSVTALAEAHGRNALADHYRPLEDRERKALSEPRLLPMDEVLRALGDGHFITDMPNTHTSPQDGNVHFHTVINGVWAEAWATPEGSIDLDEFILRPAAQLRPEFETRAFGDEVRVLLQPLSALPAGSVDSLTENVREAVAAAEALDQGSNCVQTGDSWVLRHASHGLLRLTLNDGAIREVSVVGDTSLALCAEYRTLDAADPEMLARLDALVARADALRAEIATSTRALLATAVGDFLSYFLTVKGHLVHVHMRADALDRVVIKVQQDEYADTVWAAALRGDGLQDPPALVPAWARALEAAVTGDAAAMVQSAASGAAHFVGSGRNGGWTLKGNNLNSAPAAVDEVAERLANGEVRTLFAHAVAPTPVVDDAALAAIARAASPADLVGAVQRAATTARWHAPGLEVSIYGYSLIYFDGSQKVQSFADFLVQGPAMDLPDALSDEVRQAVRACVRAL